MMQPQMLQSPARLGLPNPNSPSLSNPTTPKLHYNPSQSQQQQSPLQSTLPTTTTTTTSSTLLSLLPPLSRAQSLLLQMASLATKLFEVSPNRSVWLSAFRGSLPTFLGLGSQTQGLGLTPPQIDPVPNTVKDIMVVFTALQTQLFEAVAELQEILDLQDAKQKIARDVRSKDACLLAFANKIKEAENVLDVLVDDYSDYRKSKRLKSESGDSVSDFDVDMSTSNESVGTKLRLADILSYAHRISYTTFAPPEFGAGVGPLRGALPPAPQEEQMRASQLYAFADLDVGLPKIVKAEERTIDSLVEPSAKPSENADLGGLQGIIPSQITVPSGWQPGMPVELPPDLPLPPPGWKPGDPIPLPPMGGLAPNVEEKPRPVTNMQPKAPEPIQVRFVQLDINPEQDDDDSYSSSEASSEEDDED